MYFVVIQNGRTGIDAHCGVTIRANILPYATASSSCLASVTRPVRRSISQSASQPVIPSVGRSIRRSNTAITRQRSAPVDPLRRRDRKSVV